MAVRKVVRRNGSNWRLDTDRYQSKWWQKSPPEITFSRLVTLHRYASQSERTWYQFTSKSIPCNSTVLKDNMSDKSPYASLNCETFRIKKTNNENVINWQHLLPLGEGVCRSPSSFPLGPYRSDLRSWDSHILVG